MSSLNRLNIQFISDEFAIAELDNDLWQTASEIAITTYWSGIVAPNGRRFSVRALWSKEALYVRFEANTNETLVVSEVPNLTTKSVGLWYRDVCEVFIAPDTRMPHKYFEFEIAPNGEWIDLALEVTPDGRRTDLDFDSGMTSAVRIEEDRVLMAIKIPFLAFGITPNAGDVWLGNLFRCVGKEPNRGYLAWQPTYTEMPNFHVPERFGEFVFTPR
jgi:alpha-galactosidase